MSTRRSRDSSQILHVDERLAGATLAAAVKAAQAGLSWKAARQLVTSRHVMVDGNLCLDAGRRLKAGEVVKLFRESRAPLPCAADIRIVHVDQDLVVVVKPSGMNSVRHEEERHWNARRKQHQPTLDELLPELLARQSQGRSRRGDASTRRSPAQTRADARDLSRGVLPVHRLDRETSGLMVFARNETAEASLIGQFSEHSIERVYHALVVGQVEPATIDTILIRDRGDGLRGSVGPDDARAATGQRAVTHVRPLRRLGSCSLVECRLETGRTHQIRIHLSERGNPLCGDRKYTGQSIPGCPRDASGATRVALHAIRIGFKHPQTGKFLQFDDQLPTDLQQLVNRLSRSNAPLAPRSFGKEERGRR